MAKKVVKKSEPKNVKSSNPQPAEVKEKPEKVSLARPDILPESSFKKQYDTHQLIVYGVDGEEPFTVEDAVEFLKCNVNNRPRKTSGISRFANDMLRKKWKACEPILLSNRGILLDGQNRCEALLLAEKTRQKDPEFYRSKYGWRGPVAVPMLVIVGVSERDIDSINTGEKRTGPDVLFRQKLFDSYRMADKSPEFKEADKKKLSKILATAVRTVWLRVGGKDVSDAPKFQHSELLEFLQKHPKLLDIVVETYRNDDGAEQRIQSLCSPAYLAAVAYLGAAQETDRDAYDADGTVTITDDSLKTAIDFIQTFAAGTGLEKGDPILVCRTIFQRQRKEGGTRDRDVLLNTLVKTWNAFSEDVKDATSKSIVPGKEEICRIGGLDTEPLIEEVIPSNANFATEASETSEAEEA